MPLFRSLQKSKYFFALFPETKGILVPTKNGKRIFYCFHLLQSIFHSLTYGHFFSVGTRNKIVTNEGRPLNDYKFLCHFFPKDRGSID
jgi:hypothetical protein